MEGDEGRAPVDGLGDAGALVEILFADHLHEVAELTGEGAIDAGDAEDGGDIIDGFEHAGSS